MSESAILCGVSVVLLIILFNLIEIYKEYNIEKPSILPLTFQIIIILLIPAFILNIACILIFNQYLF